MNDLLSGIKAQVRKNGEICTVKQIRSQLSPEDQKALDEAFADPSIPATAIARALSERGIKLSGYTSQRHRRGDCNCD